MSKVGIRGRAGPFQSRLGASERSLWRSDGTSTCWMFLVAVALSVCADGVQPRALRECWPLRGGFDPVLCCDLLGPVEAGLHHCFGDDFTRDACCTPEVIDWERPSLEDAPRVPRMPYTPAQRGKPAALPDPASPLGNTTVGLVIRSFYRDEEMLRQLFHSLELYWPPHWRDIVLVLDAESERDQALCSRQGVGTGSTVPRWVRCAFEALPEQWAEFPPIVSHRGGAAVLEKGAVRAMWSLYWADNYSTADYVAEMDSDVVLTSFGVEELLFIPASAQEKPKPVWHGKVAWDPRKCCFAELLDLPAQLEMLAAFPIVLHRSHYAALRAFIAGAMGTLGDFEAGYVQLMLRSRNLCESVGSVEFLPWFQFLAGMYLYKHHHEAYHWSIEAGHLAGLAEADSCPALQVVTHVHEYALGKAGYALAADVAYRLAASRLMATGLCAVVHYAEKAAVPPTARHLTKCPSSTWCAANAVPNASTLLLTNDRVMFAAYPYGDLSYGNGPIPPWRFKQGRLCGTRGFEQMLSDYHELLRNSVACVQE